MPDASGAVCAAVVGLADWVLDVAAGEGRPAPSGKDDPPEHAATVATPPKITATVAAGRVLTT